MEQGHGKTFEDQIKALLFQGSADSGRPPVATFDIESRFDKEHGLPTSIKASKACKTIALAGARAFWSLDGPFRMIVGCWRQKGDIKEFYRVHEFFVSPEALATMRGGVSIDDVESVHIGLGLQKFPIGDHLAARKWARSAVSALKDRLGGLVLNPKIDSKNQRRLQCSIGLSRLIEIVEGTPQVIAGLENHQLQDQRLRKLVLPINVVSASRGAP